MGGAERTCAPGTASQAALRLERRQQVVLLLHHQSCRGCQRAPFTPAVYLDLVTSFQSLKRNKRRAHGSSMAGEKILREFEISFVLDLFFCTILVLSLCLCSKQVIKSKFTSSLKTQWNLPQSFYFSDQFPLF